MNHQDDSILDQVDVPLRAQPGLVCVVEWIPRCSFCEEPGIFDFSSRFGSWAHGCMKHYVKYRASPKLGLGLAQLWITRDQQGETTIPRSENG